MISNWQLSGRLCGAFLALSMPLCALAAEAQDEDWDGHHFYAAHALVSNGAVAADFTDANLVNAWGLAFNPNAVVWVANNGTGTSTLYDGAGKAAPLVVDIPPAAIGDGLGHPTGIVFSGSSDFVVRQNSISGPSRFLFASEDGSISGWAPNVELHHAVRAVDHSAVAAVYKGLALGGNGATHLLYATDFRNRRVDVFDAQFAPVVRAGAFQDSAIPWNFAPFGIQNVNGDIYVSYAEQDSAAHDNVDGRGLGMIDVFDANGTLIRRFAARGALNAPWGIALAPTSFGRFGGALLVGNFGDGAINGYDPVSGRLLGSLRDADGHKLHLDGLWGISFGNGVLGQASNALYYAAGPNGESDGVYGVVRAVNH